MYHVHFHVDFKTSSSTSHIKIPWDFKTSILLTLSSTDKIILLLTLLINAHDMHLHSGQSGTFLNNLLFPVKRFYIFQYIFFSRCMIFYAIITGVNEKIIF